jgi:hypothetical protein
MPIYRLGFDSNTAGEMSRGHYNVAGLKETAMALHGMERPGQIAERK